MKALGVDSMLSLPLLAQLHEVRVEKGDLDGAAAVGARLDALASSTGHPRAVAEAARATGRLAAAHEDAAAALAAFERMGATREADGGSVVAASLVRALTGSGRAGPKGFGALSKRELEVAALVAEGLSNPQIAERLFISVKTAGNHVSNILMKLGCRSRAEIAARHARSSTRV